MVKQASEDGDFSRDMKTLKNARDGLELNIRLRIQERVDKHEDGI